MNNIEIFQYIDNNFSTALFFFLIDHIKSVNGIPNMKIDES